MKELSRLFKAVADRNRLRILSLLTQRDLCVCELAHILKITQPSVSRHLRKLQAAGLVGAKKKGYWTECYLRPETVPAKELLRHLKDWGRSDSGDEQRLRRTSRLVLCRHRERSRPKKG